MTQRFDRATKGSLSRRNRRRLVALRNMRNRRLDTEERRAAVEYETATLQERTRGWTF